MAVGHDRYGQQVGRRAFLSHTSELRAFPRNRSFVAAAEEAIQDAGYEVVDQESFTARDVRPAEYCVAEVGTAHVYVGIIGFRYGAPVQDQPGLSYTELEFETASGLQMPRLVFLLDESSEDLPLPAAQIRDVEHGHRQEKFRRRLLNDEGLTVRYVQTPEVLRKKLHQALTELPVAPGLAVPKGPPFMAPPIPRIVERPELTARLQELLSDAPAGRPIAVTTALHGAGGFGKTTLAAHACHLTRHRFPGGVLWVSLGENVTRSTVVAKINDLSLQLSGRRPEYVDAEQAGQHLGSLLGDVPRLLVIDDVWRPGDLTPFLLGGPGCTRLMTTRNQAVLPVGSVAVLVDEMAGDEALSLLADELGDDAMATVAALVQRTGRWPVLLRLVNRALRRLVEKGNTIGDAVAYIEAALSASGPAGLDPLLPLDVSDPAVRAMVVEATVEPSLHLLEAGGGGYLERYLELAVFPEEADILRSTLERYWAHTAGMEAPAVDHLCRELVALSLVQDYRLAPTARLRLHDVFRTYLRQRLGASEIKRLHGALLDAHREGLPAADGATGWWAMPRSETYLWTQLAHHLAEAGRAHELEALVCDLRWVVAKLGRIGPDALDADLAAVKVQPAQTLREALQRHWHQLTNDQDEVIGATLLARLSTEVGLEEIRERYARSFAGPRLMPVWPLPDLSAAALLHAFANRRYSRAVAISSDDSWLASGDDDGTLLLWNVATRANLAAIPAHSGPVTAVAISPDGSWLASGGHDGTVRLWSAVDGSPRATLSGHVGEVSGLAISHDGSWLASTGHDGTVRLWKASDGAVLAVWQLGQPAVLLRVARWLLGASPRGGPLNGLAISPDGSWLASAGADQTVRLWNTADGSLRATLSGCHSSHVSAVAISPDGSWLASGGIDGIVCRWNAAGSPRSGVSQHRAVVEDVAISPDGSWLASAGHDGNVRLWSGADGALRGVLGGHSATVHSVAISSSGSWLVSAGGDGTVRQWSTAVSFGSSVPAHSLRQSAVAVSPDGSWLVTADGDGTVRMWNAADGAILRTLSRDFHTLFAAAVSPDGAWCAFGAYGRVWLWYLSDGSVRSIPPGRGVAGEGGLVTDVAISPDGTWLASSGSDSMTRLWNVADGSLRATLPGGALAISHDGSWLATGGGDGIVRLWSSADGSQRSSFRASSEGVRCLAIAPDGAWLASGHDWDGEIGHVRLWNVADGSLRSRLPGIVLPSALAISSDGSWIASASSGGAHVWSCHRPSCATGLRVEGFLKACDWFPSISSNHRLALAGTGGLYVLELMNPSS